MWLNCKVKKEATPHFYIQAPSCFQVYPPFLKNFIPLPPPKWLNFWEVLPLLPYLIRGGGSNYGSTVLNISIIMETRKKSYRLSYLDTTSWFCLVNCSFLNFQDCKIGFSCLLVCIYVWDSWCLFATSCLICNQCHIQAFFLGIPFPWS